MPIDDPARPVTAADRAAAISEVRAAAEDGRLSAAGLDERMARLQSAKLLGEVAAVLDSIPAHGPTYLPAGPHAKVPVASAANFPAPAVSSPPGTPAPAGYRPDDRLRLLGGLSGEKRGGQWVLPPYVAVQAIGAGVKLDCRQAKTVSEVIDLDVGMGLSGVTIVVPQGWGVNVDRLHKGLGTIKVKVPQVAEPGQPTLVFHGNVGAGSLTVRHARRFDR